MDRFVRRMNEMMNEEVAFGQVNNTVLVFDVNLEDVRDFVQQNGFDNLVNDVQYDYDYGYDEYLDDLTVAYDRVVVFCNVMCEMNNDCVCNNCLCCEDY